MRYPCERVMTDVFYYSCNIRLRHLDHKSLDCRDFWNSNYLLLDVSCYNLSFQRKSSVRYWSRYYWWYVLAWLTRGYHWADCAMLDDCVAKYICKFCNCIVALFPTICLLALNIFYVILYCHNRFVVLMSLNAIRELKA